MVALVVVIDLGARADQGGDALQILGGHRHGGQRAGAHGMGTEHRTDAADHPSLPQGPQAGQHHRLVAAQPLGQRRIGARHQRELALELVEQTLIEAVHGG